MNQRWPRRGRPILAAGAQDLRVLGGSPTTLRSTNAVGGAIVALPVVCGGTILALDAGRASGQSEQQNPFRQRDFMSAVSVATSLPVQLVGRVGRGSLRFVGDAGRLSIFLGAILTRVFRPPFRPLQIISQFEFVGARSTGIVSLAAVFTGLVLTLQGYNVLVRFGSENQTGTLVALSLTRELAPVLAALMVTARAGSAMAATIGNMAVTEQIDALGSLAVDPVQYLGVPRLLGTAVALPLLTALFSLAGIAASYVFGTRVLGLDGLAFMSNIRRSVEPQDVLVGLWKALVFGVLIAWIATFRGYHTRGGAQGVGRSTTRTVVDCAVLILGGDYVLTALFF